MTPLFAASLASQPGQTQTDGGTTASVAPGALRATQKSVDFTPTQGRHIAESATKDLLNKLFVCVKRKTVR